MGRITSNIGLITGIPITDTVDQLMAVAGRPRDILQARNQGLQDQQLAINTLATRVLSLQFEVGKLDASAPFESRDVASADENLLLATLNEGSTPPIGEYHVRPVQTATSQQLVSQRFDTLDDLASSGVLTFGFGGFVDQGISLDQLNDGAGFARGQIRITDLAGNSTIIDLSVARTVDDVLDAINAEAAINVTASVSGGHFVLSDAVGGGGTLTVQEVAGGTAAADLGLAGIATAASSVDGADVYGLHGDFKLAELNDGNGVRFTDDLDDVDDLAFTLADSTSAGVDLSGAVTLQDVIDAINNDDDLAGKVSASITGDGLRLLVQDVTAGGDTFAIANGVLGTAAEDLGLTETSGGGFIVGRRLVSGLRDTLLSTLDGGQGLPPLGDLDLTNRAGVNSVVDLSGADTLGEVIEEINANAVGITAAINESRNGIVLTDVSGSTASPLIVASGGGGTTAEDLGIVLNAAQNTVDGGSLDRQIVSEATLLSSIGSDGLTASDISITDSDGKTVSIDLNAPGAEAKTIGDVIDAINAAEVAVTASINSTGDGILLTSTGLGTNTLGVKDVNGKLAAGLNLTRGSQIVDIGGQDTQVIDGTTRFSVDLANIDVADAAIQLADLNEGAGIQYSDIRITDTLGNVLAFDLNGTHAGVTTVAQLIDALNADATAQGVSVTASINATNTGILLTDTAGGSGKLVVEDVNGSAAASLKILSTDETTTTINGSGLFTESNSSSGALNALAGQINELDAGVTASTFFDGVGYRLTLSVGATGAANQLLISAGESGLAFQETAAARDALLVLGEQPIPGAGVLISSSTNEFEGVIEGVTLTAEGASELSVGVSVTSDANALISAVDDFVSAYNAVRDDLDELTAFNETDLTTGLLFGSNEAIRVDTDLSRLITDRYSGLGSFQSLQQIGLSVNDQGKLELDAGKLVNAFEEDPASLRRLFTDSSSGVVAKFDDVIDRLAGDQGGLLTNRNDALQSTIDNNFDRLEQYEASLDRQRERLLLEFFQLEQIIAQLQTNQQALANFQPISPLTSSSS